MGDARRRVLVAGASGLIGTALVEHLRSRGDEVVRLVRREPSTPDERAWAPQHRRIDPAVFDGVDAVVNLSGASLAKLPWTARYQREIRDSRVDATTTLAEGMRAAATPPAVFLSGSAVGAYGDRPGESLTEDAPRGEGFLADVVADWEAAAMLAPEPTRVVTLRTGIVIGAGGVLSPLVPATKLGLGARFGPGTQHWPWVALDDEVGAIVHLLDSRLCGAVNLVGPVPATSDRITATVARLLHRWYALAVPAPVLATLMGTAARELLLADQRVVPAQLEADGYVFRVRDVEQALADFVG